MTVEEELVHPDDLAVDAFAKLMKEKLAASRAKGRSGWQQAEALNLSMQMKEHVYKGDPVDVANFCMMLSANGSGIKMEHEWFQFLEARKNLIHKWFAEGRNYQEIVDGANLHDDAHAHRIRLATKPSGGF